MRICKEHWDICCQQIELRGLKPLVKTDPHEAFEKMVEELEAECDGVTAVDKRDFDPLMSMSNHWMGTALEFLGLPMLEDGRPDMNDGHKCPICELAGRFRGFVASDEIGSVADQMVAWARAEKLLPPVS